MSSCLERECERKRPPLRGLRAGALLLAAAACAAAGFGAGCAQQPQQAAPPQQPMDIDPAMQRRDWERSVAWYPNGDIVAGVNRFPLRTQGGNPAEPDYRNASLDVLAAAAQTVALPFTYLFLPPFQPQVFVSEPVPPTYTGMPDMRPYRLTQDGAVPTGQAEELERLESPEPLPPPARRPVRDRRYGPMGPGDSEFMSSPPVPAEDWE